MSHKRHQVEARIERIKRQIAALDRIHPGSLSLQYNVCGNPRCRCKDEPPQKHGPYYQVSFTWRGKSTTRFVRKEELLRIKRELKNYQRLRALIDQWIELTMKLGDLAKEGNAA